MNASILCIVAALSAAPSAVPWESLYSPSADFEVAVRGQDPPELFQDLPPQPNMVAPYDPGLAAPYGGEPVPPVVVPNGQFVNPFSPGGPGGVQAYNPYAGPPGIMDPTIVPDLGIYSYSATGPQPYRLNQWTARYDFGLLPKERTDAHLGQFGVFEFDSEWEYSTWLPNGEIFSFTQEFGLRSWEGPESVPGSATSLPGSVYRFGWDLELARPANGPFSVQLAFNPSLNSDFEGSLSSEAWNFDARGVLYYRPNPWLMYAFGAGFWDRVNDRVVPYAGFVWTPDDRWEFRMLFPQPRISYFIGHGLFGCATWLYVRGEYHVEAYEVDLEPSGTRERVELEDWRVLFGFRKKSYCCTTFLEAGWVFGRDVEFLRGTPGFDVDTGFIARTGLRY